MLADPFKFDVAVTTYDMLKTQDLQRAMSHTIHWRLLVLDEGHRIKNEETLTARAMRHVRFPLHLSIPLGISAMRTACLNPCQGGELFKWTRSSRLQVCIQTCRADHAHPHCFCCCILSKASRLRG